MRVRGAMRAMVARGTDARRRYGRWNAKTTHPRTRSPLQEGLNLPTPSSHAARLLLAHSCSLPQHSPKPHTANAAHGAVRLPTALRLHMLAERPIRSATPPTKPPPTPRSLPAVTPLWRWRGGVQAGEGGTCVPSASQSTPYPCAGVRRGVGRRALAHLSRSTPKAGFDGVECWKPCEYLDLTRTPGFVTHPPLLSIYVYFN